MANVNLHSKQKIFIPTKHDMITWNTLSINPKWDPYPYLALSTFINVFSLFTIPVLLLTDKAKSQREEIRNNFQFDIHKSNAERITGLEKKIDILLEETKKK